MCLHVLKHIPDLQSAKAIIFDLRGYPQSDIMPIISQFIDRKIEIGNLVTPIYRFPNHIKILITKQLKSWQLSQLFPQIAKVRVKNTNIKHRYR